MSFRIYRTKNLFGLHIAGAEAFSVALEGFSYFPENSWTVIWRRYVLVHFRAAVLSYSARDSNRKHTPDYTLFSILLGLTVFFHCTFWLYSSGEIRPRISLLLSDVLERDHCRHKVQFHEAATPVQPPRRPGRGLNVWKREVQRTARAATDWPDQGELRRRRPTTPLCRPDA